MKRPSVRSRNSCTTWQAFSWVRLPTTTLTTSRCSGSRATWSQQSPWRASLGSSGLQCFCFLPTKDHFSSNWTSWVEGGKGHEFVVAISGVLAGLSGVADDGVLVHAHQAGGLADAAAVLQVLEDGEGARVRQAGAEEGGAFALGEAPLAGAAGEHAAPVRAVAEANAE